MNKRNKKHSITIVVVILMIVLLSAVGCKQEYILQYLDDNLEMVTEVYTTIDSINNKITELDSLGIKYWVE